MIKVKLGGGYTMRIWKEVPLNFVMPQDPLDFMPKPKEPTDKEFSPLNFASLILKEEGVNSVEIVDEFGQGECLHKNWP